MTITSKHKHDRKTHEVEGLGHCCNCEKCYEKEGGCPFMDGQRCEICGKNTDQAYALASGKQDPSAIYFAICKEHAGNKKLEGILKRGLDINNLDKDEEYQELVRELLK